MVKAEEVRSGNLELSLCGDGGILSSRSAFSDGDLQRIHKESGEDILTDYEISGEEAWVRTETEYVLWGTETGKGTLFNETRLGPGKGTLL